MKDEDEISDVFERAVEEKIRRQKNNQDSAYLDGVTAGLGWALEEYADSPLD